MSKPAVWICPACRAAVGSEFQICWRCGTAADGTPDPSFELAVEIRSEPERCATCGYDLRNLDTSRCPECGEPFEREIGDTPTAPPAAPRRVPFSTMLWMAIALLVGFVLLVLAN